MKTAARRLTAALVALVACGASAAALARPEAGRHAAELCVATLPKAPSCGPAQVDLRADGGMRLRFDDIVYNLQLRSSQVEVIVMHNVVQIDQFNVPFAWVGNTFRFNDDARKVRYQIRFAQAKPVRR